MADNSPEHSGDSTSPRAEIPCTKSPDRIETLSGGASAFVRTRLGAHSGVSLPFEDLDKDELTRPGAEDRYAVLGEIARGGMGAIVKIVDNDIRRPMAMKVMLGGEAGSAGARERLERFIEEARITGQLEHPNIVPVHELGTGDAVGAGEPHPYFTMKLVRGASLDSILEHLSLEAGEDPNHRPYSDRYPLANLIQIFLKVCDAVAFAHSKGVIHRDLKPENVMVGAFGEVLVMDWGLAKVVRSPDRPDGASRQTDQPDHIPADQVNQSPPEPSPIAALAKADLVNQVIRTLDGDILGTPAYMPPEQAAGRIFEVDERSDLFALGGILYAILTHDAPYRGESVEEVLVRAVRCAPVPPSLRTPLNRIPPELESICLKAMSPAPADRYASVADMVDDVQAFLDRRLVSAHRYGPWTRFVRLVQRHPAASLAGGVALILACLGSALAGVLWADAQTNAAKAREQQALARAQTARAEAEGLRAEKAEREKTEAVGRAHTAEALLEKGRKVSAVLRAAELELGGVVANLKAEVYSAGAVEEVRENASKVWEKVLAFEQNLPNDSASRAAWLAIKGWLYRLVADPKKALELFEEAEKLDRDVAYGPFYRALHHLFNYTHNLDLPSYQFTDQSLEFGSMPPETDYLKRSRNALMESLESVRKAGVWGESSAQEFLAVISGIQAMYGGGYGDTEAALTRALAIPEMAWFREETLLFRAKVRYLRKDFAPGITDVEKALETFPGHIGALCTYAKLLEGRAFTSRLEGGDPREDYRAAIRQYMRILEMEDRLRDGSLFNNLGVVWLHMADAESKVFEEECSALERAEECFTKAIELGCEGPWAHANRAVARIQLGEARESRGLDCEGLFRDGLTDAETALRLDPDSLDGIKNRARAMKWFILHGGAPGMTPEETYKQGLAGLDRAAGLSPDFAFLFELKGGVHLQMAVFTHGCGGDPRPYYEKSLGDYRLALERKPRSPYIHREIGNLYWCLGEYASINGGRGEADLRKAIEWCDKALELDPDHTSAKTLRASSFRSIGKDRLRAREDPGDAFEKALSIYEAVIASGPESPGAFTGSADIHTVLGERLQQRGLSGLDHIRRALELYDRALEYKRSDHIALMGRGDAWVLLGTHAKAAGGDPADSYRKAAADFDSALESGMDRFLILGRKSRTLRLLAEAMRDRGENPEEFLRQAILAGDEAVGLNPNSHAPLFHRGNAFYQLGMFVRYRGGDGREILRKAIADFDAILEKVPDLEAGQLGRSAALSALADEEDFRGADARELIRKAAENFEWLLKRRPDSPHFRTNLASVLVSLGKAELRFGGDAAPPLERAVALCTEALEMAPGFRHAYYNRTAAFLFLGDATGEAGGDPRSIYRKALKDGDTILPSLGGDTRLLHTMATASMRLGYEEARHGGEADPHWDRALETYDRILGISPNDWYAAFTQGELLFRLGRFEDARKPLEYAHERIGDGHEPLRRVLSDVRGILERPDWHRVLSKANLARKRGQYTEARRLYERGLVLLSSETDRSDPQIPLWMQYGNLNIAYILCFASAGKNAPLAEPRQVPKDEADAMKRQALDRVRKAWEAGWRGIDKLVEDEGYGPLVEFPEFKEQVKAWKEGKKD